MKRILVGMGLVVSALSCVAPEPGPEQTPQPGGDETATKQQFVAWSPGSSILNEHTQWHLGACGTAGARICPHSGKEFLRFHRDFLNRLRAIHEAQGRDPQERAPWYFLPTEMWNAAPDSVRTAWLNLIHDVDPLHGNQPFANAEDYGTYLENSFHNPLHGLANTVYPSDTGVIGPVTMSPSSTLFFKIHGLVESLYMRWQRGEFTDGRYSDIIVRNTSSGANAIWAMNGTVPSGVTYALPTVLPGGCNWYIGATGDFNFDGSQDIVWHGPGCNAESIWFMNGTSYSFSGGSMPAVGPAWRMIGSGDFNHDLRPDIVWANDATSQLSIWYMNGGSFITDHVVQLPAGFTGTAVLRGAYLDYYDSVVARNPTTGENRLYNWGGSGYPVPQDNPFYIAMPSVGGTAWWPIGGGHYGDPTSFGLYNLDILWSSTNLSSIWVYTGGSATGETFDGSHTINTPSPLVIAGPR